MSAQSGILASDELKSAFAAAKNGEHRILQVKIENEKMVCKKTVAPSGKAVDDMDLTAPLVDDKEPCYLVYRMDDKGEAGYKFLLMAHVPDKAHVRQKMLYAATRESLKRELGSMCFVDEIFGTVPADFGKKGFEKHLEHESAAAPLTEAEEQVTEQTMAQSTTPTKSYMTDDAAAKIKELNDKSISLVKLEKEIVELDSALDVKVGDVQKNILDSEPRFYFFRFDHTVTSGESSEDFSIMIYCCPGKTPVKSRMTYATVKPFVMDAVSNLGLKLDKKIFAPSEFSEQLLMDELHPKKVEEKKAFAKPSEMEIITRRPGRPATKRTGTPGSTTSE